ncbi:MAG TPA: twin-arginine translocase TatA/TatE family subunit [Gemmatimonadaceae bacterium]|nr:twin-arginine translocase TatA/TatE family subunit [Gemmatimonadaceae bacterium]
MNFGNFGVMEWLVVLAIVLVLFGAKRVPEIGASLGKGIREFKRSINDVQRQVTEPEEERRIDRMAPGEPVARANAADEPVREPKRLI